MRPRALVVGDRAAVRLELCALLHDAGFEPVPSETLAAGPALRADQGLGLVVLDVLPDGEGLELLRASRGEATAPPPVLVLSREVEVRDKIRALGPGAVEFVGEPYDPTVLAARARELAGLAYAAATRRTVVIIDGNATFREHLRAALETAGIRALAVGTGEEGLRLAAGSPPDAVVVDGLLPGSGAASVVGRLKSEPRTRQVPCLLLTGSNLDERAGGVHAFAADADAYERKTQDVSVLLSRIAALLRSERPPPRPGPDRQGAKRVLVVDDSPTCLEALAHELRGGGYDVALARSGEEAIEVVTLQAIDAIVLDLTLPGLSGEQTCRKLKSSPAWRDIPVLVLTAHVERAALLALINAGADDYIPKSGDFEMLKARLGAQLRRRQHEDDQRRLHAELHRRDAEAAEARAARVAAEVRAAQAEALQRQQAEIEAFFEVSPGLLCLCGFDGVFKRLSHSWSTTLGFTLDELRREPFISFVHPDDREATRQCFERALAGERVTGFENRFRTRAGRFRWLLWSAHADTERSQICAAAQDVTELRDLTARLQAQASELVRQGEELQSHAATLVAQGAELQRKNAELERASQFKSDFLTTMSHELRTPLNAVIGFSELLLDDREPALAEHQRRQVEQVRSGGRHLLTLVNDILDLAKIEAGKVVLVPEPVSVAAAVRDALTMVEAAARRKEITLAFEARSEVTVRADRVRLRQILLNLLSNAIKFGPGKSTVRVDAAVQGDRARLRVHDEGPGIAADLLPRLFRPFEQGGDAMTRRAGTGLGLAISKHLVEEHGGEISVECPPAGGTTFSVTLPVSVAGTAPPGPSPSPLAATQWRFAPGAPAPLALLVEGDVACARLVRTWLDEAGYDVVEAGTAGQAARLIQQRPPSIVVQDLRLGGVSEGDRDGLRLLRELRADVATRSTPIVVTTVSEAERERALAVGATEVFSKPLERAPFVARLVALAPPSAQPQGRLAVAIEGDPRVTSRLLPALREHGVRLLTAPTGAAGLELVRRERPAVVLVDETLPDTAGRDVAEALSRDPECMHIPLLVLTAATLDHACEELVAAIEGLLHAPARPRPGCATASPGADPSPRASSPLPPLVPLRTPPAASPSDEGRAAPGTVLVVDDDGLGRELARSILEALDVPVLLADGAEAGVAIARRDQPALVLMHLASPYVDGFAALAALRAAPETARIPVVALTTLTTRSEEARVREAGFDGYLTTPIGRRAMADVVAALLHPRPSSSVP